MSIYNSGLFVAGDEMGGLPLGCAPGALATGWYAAEEAADYLKKNQSALLVDESEEEIQELEETCLSYLERKEGNRWQDAQITLNRLMSYYGLNLKTENMLKKGMENLDDLKKHAEMKADNTHELIRCLEMKNLFTNAELILMGNLERKESRKIKSMYIHKRLDYPEQDDENWMCALSQRKSKDGLIFAKRDFRRI